MALIRLAFVGGYRLRSRGECSGVNVKPFGMGHKRQRKRDPSAGLSPGASPERGGRLGPTLFGYVGRHALRPALLAFSGLTAALFARDLLGSANLLINQGLGAESVGKILIFQLIPLATQTAPFAIAIGLFVGLGRLSGTLELVAMEACGLAPRRLLWPVFCAPGMSCI